MARDAREVRQTYIRAFNEVVYGSNEPAAVAAEVGRQWDVRYGLWLPQQPRRKRRTA